MAHRDLASDTPVDGKIPFERGEIMAEDDNKCGHEGCVCNVGGEAEYCSDHCENAADQDITEISCDCGHPGCGIL